MKRGRKRSESPLLLYLDILYIKREMENRERKKLWDNELQRKGGENGRRRKKGGGGRERKKIAI